MLKKGRSEHFVRVIFFLFFVAIGSNFRTVSRRDHTQGVLDLTRWVSYTRGTNPDGYTQQ